jgi:alkylation response protein AidB-like acyl-CoA dehydrogenase
MRWVLEDTAEQAAFRAGFRDWLREVLESGWMEAIDTGDEEGFAEVYSRAEEAGHHFVSWMRTIGESGYAAPHWPREHGGMSQEPWALRAVREELAHYRLPTFGPNILGVGLAGPTIVAHGSEAQKERYLRPILTGEEIWCQLFSEPGAGSDLASLATRATRDGDEWVINGQKVWTTLAQMARYGMLLTRTDPDAPKHAGLTYFVLDMWGKGVDVRPLTQMTGSAEFSEVYLDEVRISDDDRVGEVNDGWRCARTTLMNERNTIAGLTLDINSVMGGSARRDPVEALLDLVPDDPDPALRQRLARAYIEHELKEINLFRAGAARQAGQEPGPEGAIGKVFNAELNQRRAELAISAAGMAGVAWLPGDREAESRAEAFLRSRANTIEGGTSEILRSQIAERVLGLPREPQLDKDLPWKEIRRS